jgi:hypothetical protein
MIGRIEPEIRLTGNAWVGGAHLNPEFAISFHEIRIRQAQARGSYFP